jgi:hypothetical protein
MVGYTNDTRRGKNAFAGMRAEMQQTKRMNAKADVIHEDSLAGKVFAGLVANRQAERKESQKSMGGVSQSTVDNSYFAYNGSAQKFGDYGPKPTVSPLQTHPGGFTNDPNQPTASGGVSTIYDGSIGGVGKDSKGKNIDYITSIERKNIRAEAQITKSRMPNSTFQQQQAAIHAFDEGGYDRIASLAKREKKYERAISPEALIEERNMSEAERFNRLGAGGAKAFYDPNAKGSKTNNLSEVPNNRYKREPGVKSYVKSKAADAVEKVKGGPKTEFQALYDEQRLTGDLSNTKGANKQQAQAINRITNADDVKLAYPAVASPTAAGSSIINTITDAYDITIGPNKAKLFDQSTRAPKGQKSYGTIGTLRGPNGEKYSETWRGALGRENAALADARRKTMTRDERALQRTRSDLNATREIYAMDTKRNFSDVERSPSLTKTAINRGQTTGVRDKVSVPGEGDQRPGIFGSIAASVGGGLYNAASTTGSGALAAAKYIAKAPINVATSAGTTIGSTLAAAYTNPGVASIAAAGAVGVGIGKGSYDWFHRASDDYGFKRTASDFGKLGASVAAATPIGIGFDVLHGASQIARGNVWEGGKTIVMAAPTALYNVGANAGKAALSTVDLVTRPFRSLGRGIFTGEWKW